MPPSASTMRSPATGPSRPSRLAESVASKLRLQILSGELSGDKLPPAEVLLRQIETSMSTLREAFRILETEGLVTIHRGRHGGATINKPTAESAARHVGLLLQANRTPTGDLAEARATLEPLCASMAARRRQHVTIGRSLLALTDEAHAHVEDALAMHEHSIQFHAMLVEGSGNQTMATIIGVLESVWSMHTQGWARDSVARDSFPSVAGRRVALRAHGRIATAIRDGDAEAAVQEARAHLKSSQRFVTADSDLVNVLDLNGSPLG